MTEEQKENTVLVFSAGLQKETENTVDIDDSGEIILTCKETGHTLKLPATDSAGLKAFLAKHKEANEGQLTKAELEARKQAVLKGLKD